MIMLGKRVHIITRGNFWALKKEEATRATRLYKDKETAKKAAKRYLAEGYDIVIHKRNGLVESWQKAK